MDKEQERLLERLYQVYQQQKHTTAMEQLERVLFHDTGIIDVPAPDPPSGPTLGDLPLADRIKWMRTQPVCLQELYGLVPVDPALFS